MKLSTVVPLVLALSGCGVRGETPEPTQQPEPTPVQEMKSAPTQAEMAPPTPSIYPTCYDALNKICGQIPASICHHTPDEPNTTLSTLCMGIANKCAIAKNPTNTWEKCKEIHDVVTGVCDEAGSTCKNAPNADMTKDVFTVCQRVGQRCGELGIRITK